MSRMIHEFQLLETALRILYEDECDAKRILSKTTYQPTIEAMEFRLDAIEFARSILTNEYSNRLEELKNEEHK